MGALTRSALALSCALLGVGAHGKWIHTSATQFVRAPVGAAYSAYRNLRRMPEWSPVSRVEEDCETGISEWHLGYRGLEVSWRARVLVDEYPSLLRWESISGAENRGEVVFEPEGEGACRMELTLSYTIPKRIARLVESDAVQSFISRVCLRPTMRQFAEAMEREMAPLQPEPAETRI